MSHTLLPENGATLLRHHIGCALLRVRVSQKLTLRQLSRSASVSLGYLSEIERGQKEASSELLAAICGALSFSIPQLLLEVSRAMAQSSGQVRPTLAVIASSNTNEIQPVNIEDAA